MPQARRHVEELKPGIKAGDIERFGEIAELEDDLTCFDDVISTQLYPHAPNTLSIINKVREFRLEAKLPVYFSLDAGPNPHILYPSSIKSSVQPFINSEIKPFAEQGMILHDHCGKGRPVQISWR